MYKKFAGMMAVSYFLMFGLMYFNTYEWEHVFFSETRAFMAALMISVMAPLMLFFMKDMYKNARLNAVVYTLSALVFTASIWLVRSQATVGERSWMRAMIPHHSIAILTSRRATITDPRVRKLADDIIATQEREIAEMKLLLKN